MDQQSVLIVTDDAKFSRDLITSWPSDRGMPVFALTGGDFFGHVPASSLHVTYDLAIIGPMQSGRLDAVLTALEATPNRRLCVLKREEYLPSMRSQHPMVTFVCEEENYSDLVALLGSEVLGGMEAMRRARCAEQKAAASERHAALGRFALEMRHNFNNALTSVLGNAELMLLDPVTLPSDVWEQVQTIHDMALRMHEMMQRLTALEGEMILAGKESRDETPHTMRTFVA